MNDAVGGTAGAVPKHLWVVAALSLLWNAFGAYDYLMSVTRNAEYLSNFPPEMVAMIDDFPAWAVAGWAIGVWFSVVGAVLLFLRSRLAAPAFAMSLVGAVISFAYQFTLDVPEAISGPTFYLMPLVIVAVIVLQWWYARRMTERGVLR